MDNRACGDWCPRLSASYRCAPRHSSTGYSNMAVSRQALATQPASSTGASVAHGLLPCATDSPDSPQSPRQRGLLPASNFECICRRLLPRTPARATQPVDHHGLSQWTTTDSAGGPLQRTMGETVCCEAPPVRCCQERAGAQGPSGRARRPGKGPAAGVRGTGVYRGKGQWR